ncbi:MAG TPA: LPXTG cell wall anchor domain-containing protein [Micromonospora sp.]|nr:LPXTG cell wall anchor domain-containing protein [Micromonospora sp.]
MRTFKIGAAAGALILSSLALAAPAHAADIDGWEPYNDAVSVADGVLTMDATGGGTNIGRDIEFTLGDFVAAFEVNADQDCVGEKIIVVLYVGDSNINGHVADCGEEWTDVDQDDLTWFDFTADQLAPLTWDELVEERGDVEVSRIELATVHTGMTAHFQNITLVEPVNLTDPTDDPSHDPTDPADEPTDPASGGGGGLPVTGTETAAVAGVGVLLLGAGTGLVLLRRRRTTFEA